MLKAPKSSVVKILNVPQRVRFGLIHCGLLEAFLSLRGILLTRYTDRKSAVLNIQSLLDLRFQF